MVENADLAESFDMIGVIAGISATWVLNNKVYASSPRYRHFVKYRTPIKEPTGNRRKMFDRLAVVNLTRQGQIFENIDDKELKIKFYNKYNYTRITQRSKKYGKTLKLLSLCIQYTR